MTRLLSITAAAAALLVSAGAASLADLCTTSKLTDALPANGTLLGINPIPSSVTAAVVNNATSGGGGMTQSTANNSSSATYSYCNVTLAYTHGTKGDKVVLKYAFPSPSDFKHRFYVAGGGGYSLNSDATGGLEYGAVAGATDGGYDAFDYSYDEKLLYGNGSINWDATYMFSYQALGELTLVGKHITKNLYGISTTNSSRLYTYFEGCSDGGREGMSQVQRWPTEYDGVIAGAPAFRFAQQQVLHVLSAVVEKTLDYNPPPCELSKIVNATIEACDGLDGRKDGVVSRTDLCKLNFDLKSVIGQSYHCAAQAQRTSPFGTTASKPEQNGTVSAKGVAVAQAIYDGLHTTDGQRAYLSWQIASELSDAETVFNNATGKWDLSLTAMGGMYVAKFIKLLDIDNLPNLDGVTYDTLVNWTKIGFDRYYDSLQTTLPDLSAFRDAGGKLLHFHGESDPSIPSASSVRYWQSVRSVMYPDRQTDAEARDAMQDWYQFYLVPGAAHCGTNALQPGPYPRNNMEIMIDWVERGERPSRLNATVASGRNAGETQMLCQWPDRPRWRGNSSALECVEDQKSVDSWTYEFPAFKVPVY